MAEERSVFKDFKAAAYSAEVGRSFRWIAAGGYADNRPVIPLDLGPPFGVGAKRRRIGD
jgi:hypothetical protein